MRTIQVINVRWHNATSWYALSLAKLLADAGHETLVLTIPGAPAEKLAREAGLSVETLPLNSARPDVAAEAWRGVSRLAREFRPQVVNCHRGESFLLWGLRKIIDGRFALVRTRGDQRPPKPNVFNRWLHGSVADAVVVTNQAMGGHFRRLGVASDKIWLVHGGVDRGAFRFDPEGRRRVRAEFGYTDEHEVVGLLGRFDAVKGQRELIQAAARLRRQGRSGLRLLLLGFPTALSEAQIRAWIAEEDAQDIVAISGRRPDVAACLSALDLGVVASLGSETIARAAFEIMSCGRPLVSTRVGVMPDFLDDEALCPPGDPDALADLVASFLSDATLRERNAELQRRAMAGLGAEDFLARTLGVYSAALDDLGLS